MYAEYAWLIPSIPLILVPIALLVGEKLPKEGAEIGILGATLSFILSTLISVEYLLKPFRESFIEYPWIDLGTFKLSFIVMVDPLSIVMMDIVSFITTIIMIYSLGYMHGEEGLARYYSEMLLFAGSMLTIVMAGDLLLLFIGWELVGVSSYLLIGFWYKRPPAASAAKKAFLTTRMGDIFMLAGIAYLYSQFTTLNIIELNKLAPTLALLDPRMLTMVGIFLFIGAMGKSAQFPLMAWLWDAMEGPTTVSAILHSSTMVKAGVYLVLRLYPIMVASPTTMQFIAYIGSFTAFIAATMALVEWDIKRILAYSTISQIGYMMSALGVGGFAVGYLHLISHAFFKALLFLCAGSVVHVMHEIVHDPWLSRDMRYMGGLYKHMKITAWTMLIGGLALAGIFPLSGFWSKDAVIEAAFEVGDPIVYWLLVVTALLTALYIMRLWFNTFWGEFKAPKLLKEHGEEFHEVHLHESPPVMTGPLVILASITVALGIVIPLFKHDFVEFLATYLEPYHVVLSEEGMAHVEYIPLIHGFLIERIPVAAISLSFALIGIWIAYEGYVTKRINTESIASRGVGKILSKILAAKYGLDALYLLLSEKFAWKGISRALSWFDRNVVDGIVNLIGLGGLGVARASDLVDRYGVDGLVNAIGDSLRWLGGRLRRIEVGVIEIYALLIAVGTLFIFIYGLYLLGFPILSFIYS